MDRRRGRAAESQRQRLCATRFAHIPIDQEILVVSQLARVAHTSRRFFDGMYATARRGGKPDAGVQQHARARLSTGREGRVSTVDPGTSPTWKFTYNALGHRAQWAYGNAGGA